LFLELRGFVADEASEAGAVSFVAPIAAFIDEPVFQHNWENARLAAALSSSFSN
jgi:hypothetical protein